LYIYLKPKPQYLLVMTVLLPLWQACYGGSTQEEYGQPTLVTKSELLINPTSLVSVSSGTSACFTAQPSNDYSSGVIVCTDGKSLNTSRPILGLQSNIISEGDLLWFKVNDKLVYSVMPIKGLFQLELHDGVYQTEKKRCQW
jgi:hypothetical protein